MDPQTPEPFDAVEEASEESFPASDPPARTSVVGVRYPMPDVSSALTIENNEAARRFEGRLPEGVSVLRYRYDNDGTLILVHTEVPPILRRRGIATRLAQTALEFARDRHLEVMPKCPFVAAYVKSHPEFATLIRATPPVRPI